MRVSSPQLAAALAEGLQDGGVDVWDLGLCSTDMVTFAVGRHELAGGVMVTASHNPAEWNGRKFCERGGYPVSGEHGLDKMLEAILSGRLQPSPTRSNGAGRGQG